MTKRQKYLFIYESMSILNLMKNPSHLEFHLTQTELGKGHTGPQTF